MSTTVTKLGRHIGVIMVRPVIPHVAGIVVGYWRNGCSYRNIAREVGLHSNTVYGIIKRFCERGHFVCGMRTRRPRKTNDRDDRVLYRLARENRRFSVQRLRRAWQPYVNSAVSRKTVNRRLVARAYRARRMAKVPRLTVKAKFVPRHWSHKHINRPLGQWQHVIFCVESRFMLFRIDNRIRVRRLVGEAMHEDCTHGNVAHGGRSVHVWGGISHMGKTSLCALDQMSLEPFIAEFWRTTWFHMTGHGIATIGYWQMVMPDPIGIV